MSALVIASTEPTSLVAVNDQCSSVELWAEQCESIPELQDANNKLAAINEYLERTSAEGCARVTAARRRLEMRIGKLLGPPVEGRPSETSVATEVSLTRHDRSEFRQMAANEDEVEHVIAESTDQQPASRRKVMRAVRGETLPTQRVDRSPQAVKERERRLEQLAADGHSSHQIAAQLNVGREAVVDMAGRLGVEIVADKTVGGTRRPEANRIIAETVASLEGAAFGVGLIDYRTVDRDRVDGWIESLTQSLRTLDGLKKHLKGMTNGE